MFNQIQNNQKEFSSRKQKMVFEIEFLRVDWENSPLEITNKLENILLKSGIEDISKYKINIKSVSLL